MLHLYLLYLNSFVSLHIDTQIYHLVYLYRFILFAQPVYCSVSGNSSNLILLKYDVCILFRRYLFKVTRRIFYDRNKQINALLSFPKFHNFFNNCSNV